MKRIISCLVLVTMVLASVIAMIPASAAAPEEFNLMGNSNADTQWEGQGNVFYFDYHKYLDLGNTFPMSDKGNSDYMIRQPNSGSGSASVCDGTKASGAFSHDSNGELAYSVGDASYNSVFGYSFKESVVADAITIYLPATATTNDGSYTCNITEIDVYGSSVDVDNKLFAKEAERTLLASFKNVKDTATTSVTDAGAEPVEVIVLTAELNEALKLDYITFGVKTSGKYKFFEIELNGVLAKDAADFTALKDQYARYKNLVEDEYTADTWANLETALVSTDPVNKNATSTADEIATAAATLKGALDSLKAKPADKTVLNAAIAAAPTADKEDNYTPASWAAYKTALDAANNAAAAADGEISQSEVNAALANLQAAIGNLKAPANKTALQAEIAKLDSLKEADYTSRTWEVLSAQIAKATAVNKDENATQEDVDAAAAELKKAIEGLAKPGDKTALKAAIASAKTLEKAKYNTSALTWNVFEKAIEDAEAIVDDADATQADVDFALAELNEKIEGLGEPIKDSADNGDGDADADEDADADDEDEDATQAPATQAPATDAPEKKSGCGSAVATTAVVLGLVATLGTALVVKKRD